ncbi:hypothetical protein NXS98_03965 [Fontisphaera persica]|uniref:hypothetical protein n=1 Tax=Fontisphaera persica TaxID=2974023 RepID=UPI0024BFF364|nr:hypothetical protein [Fontisphaera persica]WCJ60296.1 hypothetical protein NXS98_03965 [Fontisphaera persica]
MTTRANLALFRLLFLRPRAAALAVVWGFCLGLASAAAPRPSAVKLWPQITDGITNHAGKLAMRCVVAEDGLTVTDTAWDSYQVAGCGKRWTFNMGAPMVGPLKGFTFPKEFAGLPVNLTVEFFNPAKPWEVKENYQEIILLGGHPVVDLPPWFRIPTNRLAYDFDEGDWFPSGWTLPRGKYALWQGAAKARQEDRRGRCPMYDFGFTHVSPVAMTPGGDSGSRERRAHLFGDNEWIPHDGARDAFTADPTNPRNWRVEPFHHWAEQCAIVIPDFEAPNYHTWGETQYEAFGRLIRSVRDKRPDTLIGCWGVGVVRSSFRIFDSFWEGKPTGVVDRRGAQQWREKYNQPEADLHPVLARCHLNLGNPSVYWINNAKPSQLYAFVQEWEQGKLARPELPNILSTWIQVEFVDGYPLSQYRFTDAKGRTRLEGLKHQVPASSTYALSLFGHCVMDGLQCWEIGARYSESLADYSDWRVREQPPKIQRNGVEVPVYYYLKYFGFYNFHVLGMWQASRNKDVIEAPTRWEMPELWTSRNRVWRTGDERYPSYVNLHKEPLVRVKLSADGGTLLLVACNPHNQGVEQVRIRRPGTTQEFTFELVGDFPIIRRFAVNKVP